MSGRIFVSFSGGRSSGMMCDILLKKYPRNELLFVFANTGQEHDKTYDFIDRCDKYFGLDLVWVEAVVHEGRRSPTHRIVTFETASRDGKPYEDVIAKYGIPNKEFPHCTRDTKLNPMRSYLNSIGWIRGAYKTALGMRSDEPQRLSKKAEELGFVYPLAEAGIDKSDVIDFWKTMPFDLGIEEREGNCKWCWKKSDKKHIQNIWSNPEWYDFPRRMEHLYSSNRMDLKPEPRCFFRSRRTTEDMIALANSIEKQELRIPPSDEDSGCAEECNIQLDLELEGL